MPPALWLARDQPHYTPNQQSQLVLPLISLRKDGPARKDQMLVVIYLFTLLPPQILKAVKTKIHGAGQHKKSLAPTKVNS